MPPLASFPATSQVTLRAETPGFFEGWAGACAGTESTCTITLTGDTEVSAAFKP